MLCLPVLLVFASAPPPPYNIGADKRAAVILDRELVARHVL